MASSRVGAQYLMAMLRRPNRLIIPQYEAPAGVSLVAMAELLGDGKRAIAAQLIDFAVRKVITIARPVGGKKRDGFTVTLVGDVSREGPDERAILVTLFGNDLVAGSSFTLNPRRNKQLGQRLQGPHRWILARVVTAGLARERSAIAKFFTPWQKHPIAPEPVAYPLVDHAWGVHDYIQWAEKDRFAYLQSPDGALREKPLNDLEVLILNEKLLPYAVLFGLEKQWMAELDLQYRTLPPEFLDDVGDLLIVAEFMVHGVELVAAVGDLVDLVDAVNALEGVGAIFGGIGEFLGNLDFPDFG